MGKKSKPAYFFISFVTLFNFCFCHFLLFCFALRGPYFGFISVFIFINQTSEGETVDAKQPQNEFDQFTTFGCNNYKLRPL